MTELPMAFWPSERGTLQGWRTGARQIHDTSLWHDWERLVRATLPLVNDPPVIFAMTEGKHYRHNGGEAALTAAKVLSGTLDRCYDVRVGWHRSGDYGPVLFFDSSVVALEWWGDVHDTVPRHWRNVADFSLRESPEELFRIALDHHDFQDGDVRVQEAKNKGFLVDQRHEDGRPVRTLYLLDGNGTASGPHLPQRDWARAPLKTCRHKAIEIDGVWYADTRSMDALVGRWDDTQGRRVGGAGFRALCEIAHFDQGMPAERALVRTVNSRDGDGIINDWVLAARWDDGLIPDTWTIHVPPGNQGPDHWPSDHRMQSWVMRI